MGRHNQMWQRKLRRNGWCRSFSPARQGRQFARDPVRPQGVQNAKLTAARGFSTAIGEIDDLSLPDSIKRGVGLFDKTFQAFGEPVIQASLLRSPYIPCWTTTHWPSLVTMNPCR